MSEIYERYKVDKKDHPVLKTIESLVGPYFLPLGRRWQVARSFISANDYRRRLFRSEGRPSAPLGPVGEVLYLAERYYREKQFDLSSLDEKLRDNIVTSTFETASKYSGQMPDPWKMSEVQKRKNLITRGLKQARININEKTMSQFFDELEGIAKAIEIEGFNSEDPSENLVSWWISEPKISQVERVVKHIEEYNKQRSYILRKINLFLSSANSFLNDSGKEIRFNPSGELVVDILGMHDIRADSLSSGETQLLILFTFLYFGFETDQEFILMIDEPELSLHLKWQHNYVKAVLGANPNAQFIFATHSPEIAQAYKDKCIELTPRGK